VTLDGTRTSSLACCTYDGAYTASDTLPLMLPLILLPLALLLPLVLLPIELVLPLVLPLARTKSLTSSNARRGSPTADR
jgi:hypothetical protein